MPRRRLRQSTKRVIVMGDSRGTKSHGSLDADIIIANAPDPIFVSDLEAKILQANDAVSQLLAAPRGRNRALRVLFLQGRFAIRRFDTLSLLCTVL
ncbi:MAG: hypothetical protein DMG70_31045 [Acidobacteria bacterium]|nr:MAG: hypothetical protein DMG70_31045 [Acidobacteriota bacterium]